PFPYRSNSLADPMRRVSCGSLRSRSECPPGSRGSREAPSRLCRSSGTDFRPQVREPVHRVILEARTVRQEKFPDLLEVLDREHALGLPSAPEEAISVPQSLGEAVKRALRSAHRGVWLSQ